MAHTNRLIHETSPYLLQHAHNPVDWHPWGEEALSRAKDEDRPILLSVGYSACHWCHVMERESFENEAIADLMNGHFVCIKVDREERPDIDAIYMEAVQMMSGQGGWPMTVFLTPEGKPFYGGTYYPPDDRYGRPGFPRVLMAVAEAWQDRRDAIEEQGLTLVSEMSRRTMVGATPEPITPAVLDQAFMAIRGGWDMTLGGFAGAPKFPQPMVLDFLMRYWHRTKRQEALEMVERTLEKMAFGGMYDQIGGGFHRYSTDQHWLVPHFEKMLYDNAQLASTYLRAWQATKDPLYRRICEETLDYVIREMTDPAGGFYSAQDADSEGEEGKFFVWTPAEVEEVLGKQDTELFCKFYDITERGNFEEKSIANISAAPDAFARSIGMDPSEFEVWLAGARAKMFAAREKRVKPGRDDKILVSWSGMMLGTFADAGAVLDRSDYVDVARNAALFLLEELRPEGRLLRTGKMIDGGFRPAPIPAFLEDYACLIDGLIRLYQATFDRSWLDRARELADRMIERFADTEGGFFDTASDAESLVRRPKDVMDNATPSGNSVAIESLIRLAVIFDRDDYRSAAADYLRKMKSSLERYPQAFARLLCVADMYLGPIKELAVIGDRACAATRSLLNAAHCTYIPNLITMLAGPGDEVAGFPLLAGKQQIDDRPTAYLCENYACSQPVTDPRNLSTLLSAR